MAFVIHDNIKIFIYRSICKRCSKNMKPLWKVININMCADTYTFTHTQKHIDIHVQVQVQLSLFLRAVAVAVAGCGGGGKGGRRQTEPSHN